MCDINIKTRKKSVTVYKIVIKQNDDYLSLISKTPIKLGEVPFYDPELYIVYNTRANYDIYSKNDRFYNKNMVGKVCGFKHLKPIIEYLKQLNVNKHLLKLKLSGDIMQGTAKDFTYLISDDEIVYAGTHIDYAAEIDINGRVIKVIKN